MRLCVIGNSCLYLGFDALCCLREMFWPVVGLTNHVAETKENKIILWHEGQLFDVGGEDWILDGEYVQGMSFLWNLHHKVNPASIEIQDSVDPYKPVWARKITLRTRMSGTLALYSKQYYNLGENNVGEQAFWDPRRKRLYHFKGTVWVAIAFSVLDFFNGGKKVPTEIRKYPVALIRKRRDGGVHLSSGTGEIHGRLVDHGDIESVIGFKWELGWEEKDRTIELRYFLGFGSNRKEADVVLDNAVEAGADGIKMRSARYWDIKVPKKDKMYRTAVKILATHCDKQGGILASCDTDILLDYRDHYRYVWPRDAAMCASALVRAGLTEYGRRYLAFCAKTISEDGFFWQRYRPDGTRGSGWHPPDLPESELPIQEDETALSLITALDYLEASRDLEFLAETYPVFIKKAARFILNYREKDGTLIKPSFDLWEERRGIFSFTQAACVLALCAAGKISRDLAEKEENEFFKGASLLLGGLIRFLSNKSSGFLRGLLPYRENGVSKYREDFTEDSSLFLIPVFMNRIQSTDSLLAGLLSVDLEADLAIKSVIERSRYTWKRLERSLRIPLGENNIGFARYPGDWYFRPQGAHHIPGNPWLVTTAWYLMSGYVLGELTRADILRSADWFRKASLKSLIMPEQINGVTGSPTSVSPLVWSHGAYIDLINLVLKSS